MPMGKPDSELAKAMIAGLAYEAENAKWIDEQDAERMMHVGPYEGFDEDDETEDADVEAVEEMTADEAEGIADEEAAGQKGIKSVSPFRGRKRLLPKSRKGGPKVLDVSLCPKCRRLVDWDRGSGKFTEHADHRTGQRCAGSGADTPKLPPLDPDPEWNR